MKTTFRKCAALIASSRFICSCYSVRREEGIIIPTHTDAVSRFGGDSRRLASWIIERRFCMQHVAPALQLIVRGIALLTRIWFSGRVGFGGGFDAFRASTYIGSLNSPCTRNPTQSRQVTRDITVQVAVFNMRVALANAVSQVYQLVRGFS